MLYSCIPYQRWHWTLIFFKIWEWFWLKRILKKLWRSSSYSPLFLVSRFRGVLDYITGLPQPLFVEAVSNVANMSKNVFMWCLCCNIFFFDKFSIPTTPIYGVTLHVVVCQGTVTVITARQVGTELIHYIDSFPDDQLVISAFEQVLARLQSRVIALEVQVFQYTAS